jgi:hypothetical protein
MLGCVPILLMVVLLACGLASAQHITSISYPGAGTSAGQGTVALGINFAGAVVGYGPDGNFVVHSYVCVSGCNSPETFTIVNAPGAGTTNNGASCFLPDSCQGTYAFSINAFGVIAGFYVDSENLNHGFVSAPPYRTITTLNEPDAGTGAGQGTLATNINLGGEIAGNYTDASGVSHGFVTASPHGNFTSFDPTGSVFTLTAAGTALNLEGAVTGVYFDASGVLHGYVRAANGTITAYNVTGAGTASGQGTDTSGINDLGAVTGPYVDSSGVNHGYVRGPLGDITTFDVPGAGTASGQGTVPETPNLFGQIAGFYLDGNGVYHGFLRNP